MVFINDSPFYAPYVCSDPLIYANFLAANWLPLCFTAIVLSIIVVGFVYMLGRIIGLPNIENYVKMEFFEIAFTFLILLFAGLFSIGLCSFPVETLLSQAAINALYDNSPPARVTLLQTVDQYLLYVRRIHSQFMMLFSFSQLIGGMTDVNWASAPGGVGISLTPLAGLSQQVNTLSNLSNVVITMYLLHLVLMKVIHYSYYAFFNFILPLGLFFRCFQPTRKYGGALIALSFGFNFIYPVLLLVNAQMVFNFNMYEGILIELGRLGLVISVHLLIIGFAGVILAALFSFFLIGTTNLFGGDGIISVFSNIAEGVFLGQYDVSFDWDNLISSKTAANAILFLLGIPMLQSIIKVLVSLMIIDVVFQTINFVIVVVAVRNLTKLFGEEIDISLLTRMV